MKSVLNIYRKVLPLLLFTAVLGSLSAEAMWSGNASVDAGEFVNFIDDYPLAGASSSFTRNTRVRVINPQNNKSVEITIVKRAPRPGVFLVLSEQAAAGLDMPVDQVLPVQVQVIAAEENRTYEEFNSRDPDINPAVSVPDGGEDKTVSPSVESAGDIPEELAPSEELVSDSPSLGLFPEDVVPVPVPEDSLRMERGDEPPVTEDPVNPAEEPVAELHEPVETDDMIIAPAIPETLAETPAETLTESEPAAVDLTMEEELNGDILPSGENVIYFLTPSDFRPPTGPATVREEREEIVPVLVDRSALEDYIVSNLNNGSSYIQLGAYSSPESIYSEIEAIEARYPMVVWTEKKSGSTIYKLLIGPLTRDETGILSYRFRDSGYADLFLYKP